MMSETNGPEPIRQTPIRLVVVDDHPIVLEGL